MLLPLLSLWLLPLFSHHDYLLDCCDGKLLLRCLWPWSVEVRLSSNQDRAAPASEAVAFLGLLRDFRAIPAKLSLAERWIGRVLEVPQKACSE